MDPEGFADLMEYYSLKKAEVLSEVRSSCTDEELEQKYKNVVIDVKRTMMYVFPAKEFVEAVMKKFKESITETINHSHRDINL